MGRRITMAIAVAVAGGCGGGYGGSGGGTVTTNNTPPPAGSFVIKIVNMRFTPADLSVPPGATITVENDDGMPHSVTSEATRGAYTPGAVGGISFDTGPFSSGQKTISIPATATAGTVVPFYCTTHLGTMATPNGSLTIDPSATPAPTSTSTPTAPTGPGY